MALVSLFLMDAGPDVVGCILAGLFEEEKVPLLISCSALRSAHRQYFVDVRADYYCWLDYVLTQEFEAARDAAIRADLEEEAAELAAVTRADRAQDELREFYGAPWDHDYQLWRRWAGED